MEKGLGGRGHEIRGRPRRRNENAQFKNTTSKSKTTHATENEKLMKEDAVWDNGRKGSKFVLNVVLVLNFLLNNMMS